jgi:N-acyl-D-aspartate/D-glutamate deacylase
VLDLLITGATVLDGSGAPPRVADVAVRDGWVVEVGSTDEPARRRLDGTGLMVAPGFVDLHTHYDAQLGWDPFASPSPEHGVTTVIGGNCGFGLAPARPEDADYLTRLMSQVEGIPLAALEASLAWDWSGFDQWLGRFDGKVAVNAGFLCGHSTLRRVVMGERAVGGEATAADLESMARHLHEALAGGALGWSTSQAPTHRDGAGAPVPSRSARREELLALASVAADHEGTQVELILPGCLSGFTPQEVELMGDLSLAARRPANWNVLAVSAQDPDGWRRQLDASTRVAARGGRLVALTLPHSMGIRLSFLTGAVLSGFPGWAEVLRRPVPERIAALRDPASRAAMAAGARSEEAGVLRFLADWRRLRITETFAPENEGLAGHSVGDAAEARGGDPFEVLLDIVAADGLRTGLAPPMPRPSAEDWKLRAEAWLDPRTVVGGSDAGAHLDMMCGATYSTGLLASVREHATVTWEQAVAQLAGVPAALYGLRDRGRLAPGYRADLTLFDPATVGAGAERTVEDLPAGAPRLYAPASGVPYVFVNGVAVVSEGRPTGATPGTVLRSGRDTHTVGVP